MKKRVDFEKESSILHEEVICENILNTFSPFDVKYARLRYGNNQELLFNIESQVSKTVLILHWIMSYLNILFSLKVTYLLNFFMQKCKCEKLKIERLDLADINGELMNLRSNEKRNSYASKILTPRSIYILVQVKENIVTPILRNSDLLTPLFLEKCKTVEL